MIKKGDFVVRMNKLQKVNDYERELYSLHIDMSYTPYADLIEDYIEVLISELEEDSRFDDVFDLGEAVYKFIYDADFGRESKLDKRIFVYNGQEYVCKNAEEFWDFLTLED